MGAVIESAHRTVSPTAPSSRLLPAQQACGVAPGQGLGGGASHELCPIPDTSPPKPGTPGRLVTSGGTGARSLVGASSCRSSPTSPSTLRKKGSWLGWGWWEPGNGCKWVGGDIERGDRTMRGREHLSDGAACTEVAGLSPGEVPLTPPSSGPWDRGAPCVPSWGSSAGSQRARSQAPRQPGPGICGEGQPRASGAVAVGRGHTAA